MMHIKLLVLSLFFVSILFTEHTAQAERQNDLLNKWLFRTDGNAENIIYPNGTIKLYLPILHNATDIMYNSEIYNNPCCLDQLNCSEINYNINPIPYETQYCHLLKIACQATPNTNECKLYPGNIDDSLENPFQYLKDTYLNLPYLYGEFNSSIYITTPTNGSYGFGLWNTNMNPEKMEFIWFMHFNQPYGTQFNGLWAMLIKENYAKVIKLTDINYYEYNYYSIQWTKNNIKMYINDNKVCDIDVQFSNNLAYHTWMDNVQYNYIQNGTNIIWDFDTLELYKEKFMLIDNITIVQ